MVLADGAVEQLDGLQPDSEWIRVEIERLRNKRYVETEQVRGFHAFLDARRAARQSCRATGMSGTGKTVAGTLYALKHMPRQELGRRPVSPVVFIAPVAHCEPRQLFVAIMTKLGFALKGGPLSDIRTRTFSMLQQCGVEMLLVDEGERLRPRSLTEVRDISDHLGIAVVLVGTDRLHTVLGGDEQVDRRFRSCHTFGKLVGEQFKQTVRIWETDILQLPLPSNLWKHKEMITRLQDVTNGYIGLLDEILRAAAIHALSTGKNKIDRAILDDIMAEYQGYKPPRSPK